MFTLSLNYQINDFLNYFSSFRRRMAPVVYMVYLVARIAFPLYLILYVILQRIAPVYRNAYVFFFWLLAALALVPLLVDFGLAFLMHRRSGDRFHDGTVTFAETWPIIFSWSTRTGNWGASAFPSFSRSAAFPGASRGPSGRS